MAAGGPGAAVLCDPHQPAAIAAGLRQLAEDEGLRARLRRAGLANAATFSWERTAQVLWQALQAAASQQP
ncbi:MAG: hypothetical protein EOO59_19465 [Hymenobacter sp.]|nr:MAG: hypothetical protein EOO59_19465 [Hymenobacter sp.]